MTETAAPFLLSVFVGGIRGIGAPATANHTTYPQLATEDLIWKIGSSN